MRVKRGEYEAALESLRKPADQRHRQARFRHAKYLGATPPGIEPSNHHGHLVRLRLCKLRPRVHWSVCSYWTTDVSAVDWPTKIRLLWQRMSAIRGQASKTPCVETTQLRASEKIWAAIKSDVLRANEGRGTRETPEETRRLVASTEVTRPAIEPGSPWWEAIRLTAKPPRSLYCTVAKVHTYELIGIGKCRGFNVLQDRLHIPVYNQASDICTVHWLLPHRVVSVTSDLAVWGSLLISLQDCYWFRIVQACLIVCPRIRDPLFFIIGGALLWLTAEREANHCPRRQDNYRGRQARPVKDVRRASSAQPTYYIRSSIDCSRLISKVSLYREQPLLRLFPPLHATVSYSRSAAAHRASAYRQSKPGSIPRRGRSRVF
ncbi:hypothetical protein PR048_015385 [Dryococelus australis]|uniref:Uncharacterized protein n=1 Tax=Dryococelus australis TaxID=614101 RepID=A0ABQ9HGT4_9NEOP|nr:hypothetical protein PR048_015385 [Dryococelus australis]